MPRGTRFNHMEHANRQSQVAGVWSVTVIRDRVPHAAPSPINLFSSLVFEVGHSSHTRSCRPFRQQHNMARVNTVTHIMVMVMVIMLVMVMMMVMTLI